MIKRRHSIQASSHWLSQGLKLFIVLSLTLSFSGSIASPSSRLAAQPKLIQLAADHPDQVVSVIVQKAVMDDRVEQAIRALGGRVTKDLHIINAVAAELKANAVSQLAKADGVRWVSLDAAVRQAQTTDNSVYTSWATAIGTEETMDLSSGLNLVDSSLGPNGTYAIGLGNQTGSVTGFQIEATPGNAITKVEVLLNGYVPNGWLAHDFKVKVWLGGIMIKDYTLPHEQWTPDAGAANPGLVTVDVTSARAWTWEDLGNGLAISLDLGSFDDSDSLALDAIGVRVTSMAGSDTTADTGSGDTPAITTLDTSQPANVNNQVIGATPLSDTTAATGSGDTSAVTTLDTSQPANVNNQVIGATQLSDTTVATGSGDTSAVTTLDTSQPANVYNQVIGATQLWNGPSQLRGRGVSVAVVDSGVFRTKDLNSRVRVNVNFNPLFHNAADRYGHGTFVAGIVAGSGSVSDNKYVGVAPQADILNVRVSDDQGMSNESDVVNALQWVLKNQGRYNIRVVNLSLNSSMAQSYQTSPLDAAVEILWFNGIVVVVSAGNNGTASLYPPANDPFVITVGATNDAGSVSLADDAVASFSAYGPTESGFVKPDLVAPGTNIIGLLPENDTLNMSAAHPASRIDKKYFKMSGTSVAAPMVSGAVALLLQDEPNLNPDQVKDRLMATANKNWPGYNATTAGAGYLDIYAAVNATTTQSANLGITASQLLWSGSNPITWGSVQWNSVQWNSVQWNSVQWNSVQWNSVQWNSVEMNSDYWGQ